MNRYFDLERRRFIAGSLGSAALILATPLISSALTRAEEGLPKPSEMDLFLALYTDGSVHITCHRSEMGQQIRTAVAQIVADELEADWQRVEVLQGLGDERFGDQNTDGSRSIRKNLERLRIVGATMRHMLEAAAAEQWGVPVTQCNAVQHEVTGPGGQRAGYAELAESIRHVTPPPANKVTLKARDQWRYIGKAMAPVDNAQIVTGEATYAADIRLPDTLIAVIARPPVVLSKPLSWDVESARAVAGVADVIRMPDLKGNPVLFQPLGGIAVLASNTWAAIRGRDQLNPTWSDAPNDHYNSAEFNELMDKINDQPGDVRRNVGDVDAGLLTAAKTLTARYHMPLLAHAPMEPPAATARLVDDGVEVWSCSQNPQEDQNTIANLLGLKREQVKVHVTLLGGAFGRKSKPDFAAEAAWLAQKTGRTVRVQWTREDDVRHDFYHTVSAQRLDGGLDPEGRLTTLRHRSTFPTIASTFTAGATVPQGEVSMGLVNEPLQIPNIRAETGRVESHVRTGWLRAVANLYHCFAFQSFLAELAEAAATDQREFVLQCIGEDRLINFPSEGTRYDNHGESLEAYPYDTGRLKYVLKLATANARWGRKLPQGGGLGLAVHRSFLTYVATVVEVHVDSAGALTIPGVWMAVDAGTVINTDTVINQMQGGAIFGLSYALRSNITAANGAIQQSNFHDYEVARMADIPRVIHVDIVDSEARPAGIGEPGTPPLAPALCNAIANACGVRIRTLPIADQLRTTLADNAV
ncbi:MAG: molybdopterin cofactor-binding domain-containing protein [Pseudomonadota bacterium]